MRTKSVVEPFAGTFSDHGRGELFIIMAHARTRRIINRYNHVSCRNARVDSAYFFLGTDTEKNNPRRFGGVISSGGRTYLLLFNTMTHAQFAGIATAALSAAAVLSWWKPTWYHAASAVTVSAFFFPALMLLGHYYANLPSWTLPFLALAGVAPLVTANEKIRSLAAWKRIGIAVSVIMLITAPVIIWGVVTSARAASSAGYY
jgi:hypothetical protein